MARKKRRASYCRLDKRERKAIEHGLDGRESCRSMARDLGRSASTIHDEVVRNRVVTRGPGKGDTVCGRPTDSQCLLTLMSRACRVQLPPLMPTKTKAATVARLDEVEPDLGLTLATVNGERAGRGWRRWPRRAQTEPRDPRRSPFG